MSRTQWLGLGLGVTGVAVVTAADAAAGTGAAWWAYLVPFLGMLSLVAATFLDRRSRTDVQPDGVDDGPRRHKCRRVHGTCRRNRPVAPPASGSFWTAVVWLVALSTFGGYGLYWLILRRSGVTKVNTLMFLMAPVTAVWGALMFGEPFGAQTVVGLTLGLLAVAVVHRGERRDRRQHHRSHGCRHDDRGDVSDHSDHDGQRPPDAPAFTPPRSA